MISNFPQTKTKNYHRAWCRKAFDLPKQKIIHLLGDSWNESSDSSFVAIEFTAKTPKKACGILGNYLLSNSTLRKRKITILFDKLSL